MAIKICSANYKGGIAKTSTALSLAFYLIKKKKKVLLIDTDPSCNATSVFRGTTVDTATLADMIFGETPADECIQHTEYGDIIASDEQLEYADTKIPVDVNRFYVLKDKLAAVEDKYDFIIFDTKGGVLLENVLTYCDYIVIPVECDEFGIHSLYSFSKMIGTYQARINPDLKIAGLLRVKYKKRLRLTQQVDANVLPQMAEKIGTKVFNASIRESSKLKESQALKMSIFDYSPNSTVALDYEEFYKELMKDISKDQKRKAEGGK